jgi:uncharacterized protein YdiU (UPF0061 family)
MNPTKVGKPRMVVFNRPLALALGLDPDGLAGEAGAAIFAGNRIPQGAEPVAQAYAGHQFGAFTMLGDGRAILLGEQISPDGRRFDIQLKGSGQTPFSRRGDGRAALGPMLREYLISEAMHALGIPTTRSLAVVATGEPVWRETALPGAILARVASSHIRVGTFEYIAARGDRDALKVLADHTIARHYPDLKDARNPYLALLQAVIERQADLVARWLQVGFIHGVMNTDNMTLSGETIDYGPCAFMDAYDPATVFSSIDHQGRYAYASQPLMAQWNLARLAETLLPLIDADPRKALGPAREAVDGFYGRFHQQWREKMRAKLGLLNAQAQDDSLVDDLLRIMRRTGADYTNTFRNLDPVANGAPAIDDPAFGQWRECWRARLARQPDCPEAARRLMKRFNPAVIPRNHRVEEALKAAADGDLTVLEGFMEVLGHPYEDRPGDTVYRQPPTPSERVYQTFCGT